MKELKESEIHGNRKILVGQVYFNYKQEPYTVVSYTDRKNVLIQFNDDIGCTKRVASWDIKRGLAEVYFKSNRIKGATWYTIRWLNCKN